MLSPSSHIHAENRKRPNSGELDRPNIKKIKGEENTLALLDSAENHETAFIQNFLDDLSVGLTQGKGGFDCTDSPQAHLYRAAREKLFLAVANNHSPFVHVTLSQGNLTLTEVETNVEVEMNGVKKMLFNTSLHEIKGKLCVEIFKSAGKDNVDLRAFAWNIYHFGGNFIIYFKPLTGPIDKSQLYVSMRGGRYIRELNGQVMTPKAGETFLCRHFATQFCRNYSKYMQGLGKINWDHFGSKRLIAETMPANISDDFLKITQNAKSYELVENDHVGSLLDRHFNAMEQQNEKFKLFVLVSTNHVMAYFLEIQETENGKQQRVLDFYDPTKTNVTLSCEPHDAQALRMHTLKLHINGTVPGGFDHYAEHYTNAAPISMIMEIDATAFEENSTLGEKKLCNFPPKTLTPTHIDLLLLLNFHNELEALQPMLQIIGQQSPNKLLALLSPKGEDNLSWFPYAIAEGQVETIRSFLKLTHSLKHLIPEGKLATLFCLDVGNGVPGIYHPLKRSEWETVQLFGECIELIPNDHERLALISESGANYLLGLLVQPRWDKLPLIHYLIAANQTKLLQIILTLVRGMAKFIPMIDMARLIAAQDADDAHGIYVAFENGHIEILQLYGEFLRLIPDERTCAKLICARGANGKSGMRVAVENGHIDAAQEGANWIDSLIKDDVIRAQLISDLDAIAERITSND